MLRDVVVRCGVTTNHADGLTRPVAPCCSRRLHANAKYLPMAPRTVWLIHPPPFQMSMCQHDASPPSSECEVCDIS